MKLMAISILILLIVPITSAFEFDLVSPKTANFNESFSVSVSTSSSGIYDVKIFVYKDSKDFSEIYNGSSWLNTRYYLKSSYPEAKSYQLRTYYAGDTEVCARLRKTNSSSFEEVCNPIKINSASSPQNTSSSNVVNSSESDSSDSPPANITPSSSQPDFVSTQTSSSNNSSVITQNETVLAGKTTLNSKPIAEKEFTAKTETIRNAIVYSFLFICVVIIVFLALRKL